MEVNVQNIWGQTPLHLSLDWDGDVAQVGPHMQEGQADWGKGGGERATADLRNWTQAEVTCVRGGVCV